MMISNGWLYSCGFDPFVKFSGFDWMMKSNSAQKKFDSGTKNKIQER
jgi:hypothetical protein